MNDAPFNRVEINGSPARADDLRFVATINYGHFTSMQVRYQSARGLELHLDRLIRSTRELFGSDLDPQRVRGYVRAALRDRQEPASVRINVYSREMNRDRPHLRCEPDVMVTVSPETNTAMTPINLQSFVYQRSLPHLKHVGRFELFHYHRRARQNGHDDALFVDSASRILEGSTWNVGFFDGRKVIWPAGPRLNGITMQLVQSALERQGVAVESRAVHLHEIESFQCAFLLNSTTPCRPIGRINETDIPSDSEFVKSIHERFAAIAWVEI